MKNDSETDHVPTISCPRDSESLATTSTTATVRPPGGNKHINEVLFCHRLLGNFNSVSNTKNTLETGRNKYRTRRNSLVSGLRNDSILATTTVFKHSPVINDGNLFNETLLSLLI